MRTLCLSDFTANVFFVRKRALKLNTYTEKDAKILASPVWNRILKIWDTLFELINICTMEQNAIQYDAAILVQNFFTKKAGTFGNNVKEPHKPRPKLKNIYVILFTQNICSSYNPMQVAFFFFFFFFFFCKHVLIL